ncbi:UNVERIFIED_ORG: type III secretion control protein HpaP [Burkholderia sp. 1263]|uniref:type III secretion system protein SctP n=1 Tax=Paraburkholderia terricola TaxID=169427 RepID=UPI0011ABF33C|nr:type III secretion system protein SctP [Paraburkholderia terricola]MDR6448575.1 type III secretion control protein HpaP [Paraburkholderia terricola]
MAIIEPRPLRIIPSAADTHPAADAARARRFDYAALVRRGRAQRPPAEAGESAESAPADASGSEADSRRAQAGWLADGQDDEAQAEAQASADDTCAPDAGALAHEALLRRLPGATLPAIDALFRTQGHFLELARSLAREVAGFCGDPAVADAGNWEVRMPLDSRILPDTTLYLSLSRFLLSLRFDTGGIETRQLLFDHSAMLERELDSLLRAWGTPRDIELTVW